MCKKTCFMTMANFDFKDCPGYTGIEQNNCQLLYPMFAARSLLAWSMKAVTL